MTCTRCKKAEAIIGKCCSSCKEYTRKAQQQRRGKLRSEGICLRCGNYPALPDKAHCGCATIYSQTRKFELIKQNSCVECKNQLPQQYDKKLCPECLKYYSERAFNKRRIREQQHLCVRCGSIKEDMTTSGWCNGCKRKLRMYQLQLKKEVFTAYGGKCNCCGITDDRFLNIDHINGGGTKHRDSIKRKLYNWLKSNSYPVGYQVLCFNCNCGRSVNGGICPHQDPNI